MLGPHALTYLLTSKSGKPACGNSELVCAPPPPKRTKGSRGAVLKCQEPLAIRWQRCQPALWLRRPSLDPVAAPHQAARGMCSEAAGGGRTAVPGRRFATKSVSKLERHDARRHHTRPSHSGKLRIRRCSLPQYPAYCLDIPAPHFAAASAILCDDPPFGLTSRRYCSAGRHPQSGGHGSRVTISRRSTCWHR